MPLDLDEDSYAECLADRADYLRDEARDRRCEELRDEELERQAIRKAARDTDRSEAFTTLRNAVEELLLSKGRYHTAKAYTALEDTFNSLNDL